jgi:hypothetical protein
MQKCLHHLIRNATEVELTKIRRDNDFTSQLKKRLQEGIALLQQYRQKDISPLAHLRRCRALWIRSPTQNGVVGLKCFLKACGIICHRLFC